MDIIFHRIRFQTTTYPDSRSLLGHFSRFCSQLSNWRAAMRSAGIASSVTPAQVCEQLKKMVKSSSPALTSAPR